VRSGFAFLLCVLAAAACSGLKSADISVTINTPEAGAPSPGGDDDTKGGDDDTPLPPPAVDAGNPPDDFSCAKDYWVLPDKTRPDCAARRVTVISPTTILMNNGVSIARTSVGRIGISFNDDPNADTSKLRVAHFKPTKPDFDAPAIVTRDSPDFEHVGT